MNLRGRVVLITGARRVGADLARTLAARGAHLAITYKTGREPIERLAADLQSEGAQALAVAADLSRAAEAQAAVARTVERFGRIDALVNLASTFRPTPFAQLAPADFDELIGTNLAAPYFASVAAGKAMLAQSAADGGPRGKIVIVGDSATDRPPAGYLPYLVAKGALTTLTLALARELAPGVLVNLVQPGPIEPPPGATAEDVAASARSTLVGRVGAPADLNNLILYLLEGTDFATGGVYRVDGGRFLGGGHGPA